MLVVVLSMWIVRVSGAYILAYPLGIGPLGIWFAMGGDFIVRSVCFALRWRRGKWQAKKVIMEA